MEEQRVGGKKEVKRKKIKGEREGERHKIIWSHFKN